MNHQSSRSLDVVVADAVVVEATATLTRVAPQVYVSLMWFWPKTQQTPTHFAHDSGQMDGRIHLWIPQTNRIASTAIQCGSGVRFKTINHQTTSVAHYLLK